MIFGTDFFGRVFIFGVEYTSFEEYLNDFVEDHPEYDMTEAYVKAHDIWLHACTKSVAESEGKV